MPSINGILAGAIGALLLIIVGLSVWLYIDTLKIEKGKSDLMVVQQANTAYQNIIALQNKSVQKLQDDNKAAEIAAAKAVAVADAKNKVLDQQIVVLTKAPLVGEPCKAADDLFKLYLGGKK